jgi:cardiolipin synthase
VWIAILLALFLVWVGSVAVVIILQRRSAAATLAWLFALMFLPIIGLVIYRIIGPLRLERRKLRLTSSKKMIREAMRAIAEAEHGDAIEHLQLARVGMTVGESGPLRADEVTILLDGDSTYAALTAAVEAARHHVHLEYYIWEPDQIGTRLRDALCARAKAGVAVRMIVDGTGASGLKERFLRPLEESGVQVAWFNPVRLRSLRMRRPDFRTHRKIVVCDGAVGFTGGMNITDVHAASLAKAYWRDTHLRLRGPAVWSLQRLFLEDWYYCSGQLCPVDRTIFPAPPDGDAAHIVQVLGSGPDSSAFAIHKAYFTAINQATRRLWLTTPYFVPDEAILAAMITAALRKVDVRLIIPRKGDSRLVDLAARSYVPELVAAGVRVFEYEPRFIHAKTGLFDEDVAIVGTANLDNRSFRLNFEVAAVLFDVGANRTLADAFLADQSASREITAADLEHQPFWTRFGQASARLMSPLL